MNSSRIEYSEILNDHSDPITYSNQFDPFESSELKLTLTPFNENVYSSYFSGILSDSICLPYNMYSDEKKAAPEELNSRKTSGAFITSFDTILKKKSLNDFAENSYNTRNTTKRLKNKSFSSNVQDTVQNDCGCKPDGSEGFELVITSKGTESTSKSKAKRQKKISAVSVKMEESFHCKLCGLQFNTSQGLGGHMSRAHPGKSSDYKKKKDTRKTREVERYKLQLAKKKFFKGSKYNYQELTRTKEGKKLITQLVDKKKLRKIKKDITKEELDDFIEGEVLCCEGFERK